MTRITAYAALALTLVGCAKSADKPTDWGAEAAAAGLRQRKMVPVTTRPSDAPKDARADVPLKVYMDVYQISVPLGSVSRNEDFWKRLDENVIDVGTRDLLLKNGVRVGVAPTGEWDYFKKIIDQNPAAAKKQTFSGAEIKPAEVEMKKEVPEQCIFAFGLDNSPAGRSYWQSQNLLSLTFTPVPRQVGDVRVAVCPLVRSLRKELVYDALNRGRGIEFVNPEYLYDLNLTAVIPLEHFLVIAPSPEADISVSLGFNFLIDNGPAERLEQVILLVPRPFRVDEVTGVARTAQ